MYIHLGAETVVKKKEIIGIFDIEGTTVSKWSRSFLNKATKKGRVVTVSFEMPKSFVVCEEKESREKTVYISPLSAATLQKRFIDNKGL